MQERGWQRNLAALLTGQTLVIVAFSFVQPFLPLFIKDLGVTGTDEITQWSGVMAAASSLAMAIAQPIWGSMADRFGRKLMVIRAMACSIVIIGMMAVVRTPEELLALRLAQGALSGTVAASTVLVATSTPSHRLGYALGLMQVAIFTGNSIGPLVGGVVADAFGFRTSFLCASAIMTVGFIIVLALVKENFTKPDPNAPRQNLWRESWAVMTMGIFPALLAVNFLVFLGPVMVMPVFPLFIDQLNSSGGNTATVAGLIFGVAGISSSISAIVLGRLSDRYGHFRMLAICTIGSALAYFPQAAVSDIWQLLGLRVLLGVFSGGLGPSTNAIAADLVPAERRGVAFGVINSINSITGTVGPLGGAAMATQWGIRSIFTFTGALFTITFAWVLLAFRGPALSRVNREPSSTSPESSLED